MSIRIILTEQVHLNFICMHCTYTCVFFPQRGWGSQVLWLGINLQLGGWSTEPWPGYHFLSIKAFHWQQTDISSKVSGVDKPLIIYMYFLFVSTSATTAVSCNFWWLWSDSIWNTRASWKIHQCFCHSQVSIKHVQFCIILFKTPWWWICMFIHVHTVCTVAR